MEIYFVIIQNGNRKTKKTMETAFQMLSAYFPSLILFIIGGFFYLITHAGKDGVFAMIFMVIGYTNILVGFIFCLSLGLAKASLITNCYKVHMRPLIFPDTDSKKE